MSKELEDLVSAEKEYENHMKAYDEFSGKEKFLEDKVGKLTLDYLRSENLLKQYKWSITQPSLSSNGLSITANKSVSDSHGLFHILNGKENKNIYIEPTVYNRILIYITNNSIKIDFDNISDAVKFITEFKLEVDVTYLKNEEQIKKENLAKLTNLIFKLS